MAPEQPAPPPAPPATRGPGLLGWSVAVLVLAAAGLLALRLATGGPGAHGGPEPALLPDPVALPAFSLENAGGGRTGLAELRGKTWIADFIFTSCAGVCPEMAVGMRRVQREVAGDPDTLCVSISVDPERDTAEALRAYAAKEEAVPGRWIFLRGEKEVVHALGYDGFGLLDRKDPFLHSQRAALVDGDGRIRGYYRLTDPEGVEELLEAWRRVRGASRP
jgi:protein SCO1/2